jgi:hypothetical protein
VSLRAPERNVWGEAIRRVTDAEVLTLVEPGFALYSAKRRDHNDFPIGGTVWKVEPWRDRETGETGRRFHIVRSKNGRPVLEVLEDSEVDLDVSTSGTPSAVRDLIRKGLARELAQQSGGWLRDDRQLVHAMFELSKVLDA